MEKIFDITPDLTTNTRVYPGDQKLEYTSVSSFNNGEQLMLSNYTASTHLGAHINAPLHFIPHGKNVGGIDLNRLIGMCQVVKLNKKNEPIFPKDLPHIKKDITRLLISTNTSQNFDLWSNDFTYLSPELIDFILEHKIKLIGLDSPSVDAFESENSPIHNTLLKNDIIILENLLLNEVPAGIYELIALPIKLIEAEAAPIRAILRTTKFTNN